MSSLTLWPSTEKLCRLTPAFFRVILLPVSVKIVGSNTLALAVSVVVVGPPPDGDALGGVVAGEVEGEDPPQATPNRRTAASTVKRTSFMVELLPFNGCRAIPSLPDIRLAH